MRFYDQRPLTERSFNDRREKGQIVKLKSTFGFIRTLNRSEEIFFHLNCVETLSNGEIPMFSVGDNVAFSVNIDRQNGRLYANNVRSIPTGSVIFEELLENEGRKKAVVTKEIGADSIGDGRTRFSGELRVEKDGETLRFRRRDLESKQIKLLKGDKVEISVFVDKKTRRRGATQIVLKEPSLENREYGVVGAIINSSYGFIKCADRNDPKLFFHFSERLQEDYFPKEGDNIAFNVTKDRNDQLCAMRLELVSPESVKFVKILRPIFNGTIMTSLKWFPKEERWEEGQITFKTTLVNRQVNEFLPFEYETNQKNEDLIPGDKIQFQIAVFKPTGRRHACQIQLLSKAKHKTEKGVIAFIKKGEFGFIERPTTRKNIYFSNANFENLAINDCVEYSVIEKDFLAKDFSTKKGKNEETNKNFLSKNGKISKNFEVYAVNVKKIEANSVDFFRFEEKRQNGVVEKSAVDKIGLNEIIEENKFDGVIKILSDDAKIDVKISYKQRNLVDPKIDIFEGDIVSFRKKFDLRFNGSVSAIQIVLIKPNESFKRSEGIVISLKRDFGFLTCLEYPDGLFFHFSSVVGDAKKSLSCNDEFSFEIKTDGNGKAIATRMIKLAKNTVQLDDIDSTPFIGKIINTGYSYKLDDDFLGNGNGSLEYCYSGIYNDVILNISPETVINHKNNREIEQHLKKLNFRSNDFECSPFSVKSGDFVLFNLAAEKATERLRATKIRLLPKLGTIKSLPELNGFGELQDYFSREFFDFKESGFSTGAKVIFEVSPSKNQSNNKREAIKLRKENYLILEKGFYEGYVKEIVSKKTSEVSLINVNDL